jgi:hypothetical protein
MPILLCSCIDVAHILFVLGDEDTDGRCGFKEVFKAREGEVSLHDEASLLSAPSMTISLRLGAAGIREGELATRILVLRSSASLKRHQRLPE